LTNLLSMRWVKTGVALAVMLLALLGFAGSAAAASPSVVINEVYAPVNGDASAQWVELYNRSNIPLLLDGWQLRTAQNEYPLPSVTISPTGYLLVAFSRAGVTSRFTLPAGAVIADLGLDAGTLNPQADLLALVSPAGLIVDQMNWGPVNSSWKYASSAPWSPGIDPLTDPTKSIGRTWTSEGKDTDSPSDFTVHDPPSPGSKSPFAKDPSDLLGRPTDYVSWAAGVLLWLGFILAAFIARRFQALSGQRTYWQALLIAPSGIVIYTIIQGLAFSQNRAMNDGEKWTGFTILFLSAVLCFYVIAIFSQIAKRYLEASK
jgi:Lamin Tail Domain